MLDKKTVFDRVGGAAAPGLALKNKIIIIGNQIIYDKSPFETLRGAFYAFSDAADVVATVGNGLTFHQCRRLAEISQQLFAIYKELNKWQIDEEQLNLFDSGVENLKKNAIILLEQNNFKGSHNMCSVEMNKKS